MLLEQKVKIKWHASNKKYYMEKCYPFTKMGDEFEVDITEVSQYCRSEIVALCDYCGEKFTTHYHIYMHNLDRSYTKKDCCEDCIPLKRKETTQAKYGADSVMQVKEIKDKSRLGAQKGYYGEIIEAKKEFTQDEKGNYLLQGETFGLLTVLQRADGKGRNSLKVKKWVCQCSCKNKTIVIKDEWDILNNAAKSCGCISPHTKEIVMKTAFKHGESRTRLYKIWKSMVARCGNPNDNAYKNYGGRGIKVYIEWKNDFLVFKEWALNNGYTEELSIERIDVNGNYCPENCTWATFKEQSNNKRDTRIIEINGEAKTIYEWSKVTGLPQKLIRGRVDNGMTGEKLLMPKNDPKCKEKYVTWHSQSVRWVVCIPISKKSKDYFYIGSYKDLDDAIKARDEAIKRPDIIQAFKQAGKEIKIYMFKILYYDTYLNI